MFKKSYIVIKNINKIYNFKKNKKFNYQKVLWNSKKSMIGRYWLLKFLIRNKLFNNWLDVGCGTGDIFKFLKNKNIKNRVGLEPIKYLYQIARKKNNDIKILKQNLLNINTHNKYDLISCIGVLQNCGSSPLVFLNKICKLLKKNGYLFLTSKNLNWYKFKSKSFKVEKNHSWFDINEVKLILKKNNLKIIRSKGFFPEKKKLTNFKFSHTFFIWAKKN